MKKNALVTGGSSGIGLVTAIELAKNGYDVTIVGRSKEKTENAVRSIIDQSKNENVQYLLADLSKLEQVKKMATEYNDRIDSLHLLVNNAGCVYLKRELSEDGFEKTFTTNHLSHFLLTSILLEKIKKAAPARIINVSSEAHYHGRWNPKDIHLEKKYKVMWAYSNSKLANVLFTNSLARKLKGDGITANSLHPGLVKTKIGNKNTNGFAGFAWSLITFLRGISVEKGAETTLHLALSDEVQNVSGKFFEKCKEKEPAALAKDEVVADELWEKSEEMVAKYLN